MSYPEDPAFKAEDAEVFDSELPIYADPDIRAQLDAELPLPQEPRRPYLPAMILLIVIMVLIGTALFVLKPRVGNVQPVGLPPGVEKPSPVDCAKPADQRPKGCPRIVDGNGIRVIPSRNKGPYSDLRKAATMLEESLPPKISSNRQAIVNWLAKKTKRPIYEGRHNVPVGALGFKYRATEGLVFLSQANPSDGRIAFETVKVNDGKLPPA